MLRRGLRVCRVAQGRMVGSAGMFEPTLSSYGELESGVRMEEAESLDASVAVVDQWLRCAAVDEGVAAHICAHAGSAIDELEPAAIAALFDVGAVADPGRAFLNHGAFGGPLVTSTEAARAFEAASNTNPPAFFDRFFFPALAAATRTAAHFFGAPAPDLALTSNPTTALNALVASLADPDAPVLVLSTVYGSVARMAAAHSAAPPATVAIALPALHPGFAVRALHAALDAMPVAPALAVFDHVSSDAAYVAPVADMAAVLRAAGIPFVVDGAHGPLAQDVGALLTPDGPDYYVGSFHKWMSGARGAGFLWTNPAGVRAPVAPPIISHGAAGSIHARLGWDGTRSYSAMLSVGVTCDTWRVLGVDAARARMHNALREGVAALTAAWGTAVLDPHAVLAGTSMAVVALPSTLVVPGVAPDAAAPLRADALQNLLFARGVDVPVKVLPDGGLGLRVSAHVYTDARDWEKVVAVVDTLFTPTFL